jgi:hypothetical protein
LCVSANANGQKPAGAIPILFYSFDCEEPKHVHVAREKLRCKFWLAPLELAQNDGFAPNELNPIRRLIEANRKIILEAWNEHCD